MAKFKKRFCIEMQLAPDSCISAAACSLIAALGYNPVDQSVLHALIAPAALTRGRSGFQQLEAVLPQTGSLARATAYQPAKASLRHWIEETGESHQGLLVSLSVDDGAHIVVVYRNAAGAWRIADPGTGQESNVRWDALLSAYAGDTAIVE